MKLPEIENQVAYDLVKGLLTKSTVQVQYALTVLAALEKIRVALKIEETLEESLNPPEE